MSTSTSKLAYADCFDLLDRAVADAKGVRIKFADMGDAWAFRLRLHSARKIARMENKVLYKEGDPMYGRSVYDVIVGRIREDGGCFWLYLEKLDVNALHVESLSEEEEEEQDELT